MEPLAAVLAAVAVGLTIRFLIEHTPTGAAAADWTVENQFQVGNYFDVVSSTTRADVGRNQSAVESTLDEFLGLGLSLNELHYHHGY